MLNKLKPKSEFSRNVLTLMTGTTIAQAIPIAVSPILTRLYTPEDFGVFALYISLVSFLSIIVTGRYEMAIVLPKTDKEALNILGLSLLITFLIVGIVFFIILFFKEATLNLLNAQKIGDLIYIIPFSILLSGLYQSFNYWFSRKKNFKNISSAQIYQSLSTGFNQLLLGYFKVYGGLIIGNIFGKVLGVFIFITNFFKYNKLRLKDINLQIMLHQLKKYKDFPLINSLHALSDAIRNSGSVILISSFFGSGILGFYSLSMRVLQVPIGIVGSAIGQVLYQKFTILYHNKKGLYKYVKKIFFLLILIALPIFATLYFIAPALFAYVFGEKWRVAGEYSQILVPYLFMNFLLSPLSSLPLILNKQKEIFYIGLVGNILLILTIIVFSSFGIVVMLKMISLIMSLYYLFVIYWFYKVLKNEKSMEENI